MGFEYVEEELELKIKEKVYKFRSPSAVEQKKTAKRFKEADENTDAIDLYIEFFENLGLPREALEKMSAKGLMDLFSYAIGAKKN